MEIKDVMEKCECKMIGIEETKMSGKINRN